jgi:hypothetical protein
VAPGCDAAAWIDTDPEKVGGDYRADPVAARVREIIATRSTWLGSESAHVRLTAQIERAGPPLW